MHFHPSPFENNFDRTFLLHVLYLLYPEEYDKILFSKSPGFFLGWGLFTNDLQFYYRFMYPITGLGPESNSTNESKKE